MLTSQKIAEILKTKLNATSVQVVDQSSAHAGHKEAKLSGGGHYDVIVVSEQFQGLESIDRHRKVYEILSHELKNEIHALSIKAYTPHELMGQG